MSNDPAPGDFVHHETLGLGKVVSADSALVRVYFKNSNEANPDNPARSFKVPSSDFLKIVEYSPDSELDNLPPFKDGKFVRFKTELTLKKAKDIFLSFFSDGLDDKRFIENERRYKVSASERYRALFEGQVRAWIDKNDHAAIAASLDAVYGDPKAPKDGPHARLNLLYQKVEEPAFFDAIRAGGEHTVQFAEAALDFIQSDNQKTFDRYLAALRMLPTRKGGTAIDQWTTLTWLPFIAAPDRHFLIKPTIVQEFSSALLFEIDYRSDINYQTYANCVGMARRLAEKLGGSEVNLHRRNLDLIEVQSFMWVVARYF